MSAIEILDSKILNKLDFLQKIILILSTGFVIVLLGLSIIFRYILHINMFGLEELVQIGGYYLYFVGAGFSVRLGYEIKADLVGLFVKNQKTKSYVYAVTHALTAILSFMFVYWGFGMILWGIKINPTTPGYHLPMLISYVGVELGLLFGFVYSLFNAAKFYAGLYKTRKGCK